MKLSQKAPIMHTSPLGSAAMLLNCTAVGVVKVRKLRYLTRSKARTVPSKLQLRTALPLGSTANL